MATPTKPDALLARKCITIFIESITHFAHVTIEGTSGPMSDAIRAARGVTNIAGRVIADDLRKWVG
jgi:hypothetical protein